MKKIALVEDDADLFSLLKYTLEREGYSFAGQATGKGAVDLCRRERPDLLILDITLPYCDGLEICRQVRSTPDLASLPVIFLTARASETDRILGLELGANDYLVKPFSLRELLARIKSVLRRSQARPAAEAPAATGAAAQRVRFGRCRLDVASHQLFDANGGEIPLTSMEFDLLKIFVEHPGKALSRDRILTLTKNREWDPYDRSIDIRIARLRRKVEADPEHPQVIRTVRGVGYMYVPSAS